MSKIAEFGAFWMGRRLPALDGACLRSISRHGHRVKLFSYEQIENVPDGIENADAATIVDRAETKRFLVNGRPNLSHFTDLFRYKMFERDSRIWVDTDVLMLDGSFDFGADLLLAREAEKRLCGAIMFISTKREELQELIKRTLEKRDINLRWGETGPILLTQTFSSEEIRRLSAPQCKFFPIKPTDFWKTLLPEHAAECEAACSEAATVHLWNNIFGRLGYWKDLMPPEGSFLHQRLSADGAAKLFRDVYPADIMRQMVENWRMRQTAGDVGIKQLLSQFAPSIRRTWLYYHPRIQFPFGKKLSALTDL